MKFKRQKPNKYTLREIRRKRAQDALKGSGAYRFLNNTRGDLTLPKPPIEGPNPVPPGKTFIGDSYFFMLMRAGEVRLIETITPKDEDMEKKLILDQPERFTNKGQTEHVVEKPAITLHENKPTNTPSTNKLLTEDPLDGVEILLH